MLKRRERLSRREFDTLYKKGHRIHGDHFLYIVSSDSAMKCGVSVSKKVHKHAVDRHTLRRRVYAVLEEHRTHLSKKHIIVVVHPSARSLTRADLRKELSAHLRTL